MHRKFENKGYGISKIGSSINLIGAIKIVSLSGLIIVFGACDNTVKKKNTVINGQEIESGFVVMNENIDYTSHMISEGESLFSIVQDYELMELCGRNIYKIIEEIKAYNIEHPDTNSSYHIIVDPKPFISDKTKADEELPVGAYLWIPTMQEYQLTPEEKIRKNEYNKLFEGNEQLNINKNLKWASIKIEDRASIEEYIKLYHKSLARDGYNRAIDDIWAEFRDYNSKFYAKLTGFYGFLSKDIYDGEQQDISAPVTVQIPLYNYVTAETILNDLTEKEKYENLDENETIALNDMIAKMQEDEVIQDYEYALLVNTLKKKGKHQVILYNLKNKTLMRRYICSTGDEKGLYHPGNWITTPKGIFRIGEKIGEGRQTETFWDGRYGQQKDGRPLPLSYDENGNFCRTPRNNNGATMSSRIMTLKIGADIYFHGTNKIEQLGYYASAGCIRMLPKDVMELFEITKHGTYVNIMDPLVFL